MILAPVRLVLTVVALSLLAPGPPIYPGAKPDTPQALIEKSSGVEASATYSTADPFEKVDSFYRAHGAEDTGARRIATGSKRALYYFADSKTDVLVLWPKDGTSDQTSITFSKE
ncbi:MAG TPA: hypothetical protein VGO46_17830 [Gemmatimonadaceae bacterium]|jgi:hypothetical protein|nr:hypothetical protein [Gemmatimonadaceae bacterium]